MGKVYHPEPFDPTLQLVVDPNVEYKAGRRSLKVGLFNQDGTPANSGVSSPPLDGTVDGVGAKILVQPDDDFQNAIVVKSSTPTWGVGAPYGAGQALVLLKNSSDPTQHGYSGIDPDDLLLARLTPDGSAGLCGNLHIATGLRQPSDYASSYAVQIQPYIDTQHIQLVAVAGQAQPVLAVYDSLGAPRFRILPNGSIKVNSGVGGIDKGLLVGDVGAATSNFFGLAHSDQANSGGYALQQGADGTTFINAASGKQVTLRINNAQRVVVSGTGLGFNGNNAIAKPSVSGSRGGNAALASLLTALANYGLITDTSSA